MTRRKGWSEDALERDRARSRAWKARQRGRCEACGAETRYGGQGGRRLSRLCVACGRAESAERGRALRGSGPLTGRLLELLSCGPTTLRELLEEVGEDRRDVVNVTLIRLRKYGLVERVSRGVYTRRIT